MESVKKTPDLSYKAKHFFEEVDWAKVEYALGRVIEKLQEVKEEDWTVENLNGVLKSVVAEGKDPKVQEQIIKIAQRRLGIGEQNGNRNADNINLNGNKKEKDFI